MSYIKELLSAKCIIVIYQVAYGGGSTKSIFSYYKHSVKNNEKVMLIIRDSRRGGVKLLLALLFGKKIIINGLGAFKIWDILLFCYFRKDAIIYLHEAEHALDYFKKRFPNKYNLVARILRTRQLLCVSEWQAEFFQKKFYNRKIRIIYETIDADNGVVLPKDKVNIVMVGYYSERKGVTLFSQIADLVKIDSDKIWQFHWAGTGPKNGLYFSPHVNWVGEMSHPLDLIKQADVFLLTSVDDPFPLVCLEALSAYKKCVVYKNTGTAEIIKDISGYAVYEEYTPICVINAIEKVITEVADFEKVENINRNISSVESFAKRLDSLVSEQV